MGALAQVSTELKTKEGKYFPLHEAQITKNIKNLEKKQKKLYFVCKKLKSFLSYSILLTIT